MKLGIIFVTFNTPKSEMDRIKQELNRFNVQGAYYIHDSSRDNNGYAYGINKCITKAIKDKCDVFMILNTDISILKISLDEISKGLKKFDILGGVMHQKDEVYYGGQIDKWRLSGGLITTEPHGIFSSVDYVTGSMIILKKNVIDKIDLFDEKYFMYYEDVDYGMKARKANLRVGIDKNIVYKHFENASSVNKKRWLRNNRIKFFKKNANLLQWLYEIFRLPKTIMEEFRTNSHSDIIK